MPIKKYVDRNRKFIEELRAQTVCARCGKQPIDWHSDTHLAKPKRRIAAMSGTTYSIKEIKAEIAKCEPLCRHCHMKQDGRLEALRRTCPNQKGIVLVPLKPCVNCGKLAKPLRKGLCNACNHRKRSCADKRERGYDI